MHPAIKAGNVAVITGAGELLRIQPAYASSAEATNMFPCIQYLRAENALQVSEV